MPLNLFSILCQFIYFPPRCNILLLFINESNIAVHFFIEILPIKYIYIYNIINLQYIHQTASTTVFLNCFDDDVLLVLRRQSVIASTTKCYCFDEEVLYCFDDEVFSNLLRRCSLFKLLRRCSLFKLLQRGSLFKLFQ